MGSWCAEKLRNCSSWRDEGLEMSTTSNESATLFDSTLRQLVSWIDCEEMGGLVETANWLIAADPKSVMARALCLGMDALGTNRSIRMDPKFGVDLDNLISDSKKWGNRRERLHCLAVRHFALGEMSSASAIWEQILADYPTDLMAIKFAHDAYFFRGDYLGQIESIERVLPKWNSQMPMASYLSGMHAFALEETGKYSEAEKAAEKALDGNRQDAWAIHARAHCYEMKGQWAEGIGFMEKTMEDWNPCWLLSCHNHWHRALFYLESGDFEGVLDIYDREISKRCGSKAMLDIVDAASLLSRLEIEGIKVGKNRWGNLTQIIEPHLQNQTLSFNDVHISMVAAFSKDSDFSLKHSTALQNFIQSVTQTHQKPNFREKTEKNENQKITEKIGIPLGEAINDFSNGNYGRCFEGIYPIRKEIISIGGSNAQRDVFTLFLLESGLRTEDFRISFVFSIKSKFFREILNERKNLKPKSALLERILQRHRENPQK